MTAVPEVQLPDWADRPVLRPGVGSSPEQLGRLQAIFPERRLRPFTSYFLAVVDPFHVTHHVVPVSLDVHLPPERWLEGDWRDLRCGRRLILTTFSPPPQGAVRVRTIRELVHTWRLPTDATTEPMATPRSILESGVRRVVPIHSRPELIELCGEEGDDLFAAMSHPGGLPGEHLTIYRNADTWTPILERARKLGATELRRRGVPRTTAYALVKGRPPSGETAALVARIIDGETGCDNSSDLHSCARPGCPRLVRGRKRWCGDACKKAVRRANDRLALHAIGGTRCRRCGAARFGELRGPCPTCHGRGVIEVRAVRCLGCGTDRLGDTSSECPFCGGCDIP